MTHPDFRALCAELLAECRSLRSANPANLDLWDRARAALAAEPGEGGSAIYLEQVDELCAEHGFHYDGAESLIVLRGVIAHAIARYGAQAVPVAERLPGEGDCDAEGRCWFITYDNAWLMEDRTYAINAGRSHWLPCWALPLPEVQP
jgi:hypothetical protein